MPPIEALPVEIICRIADKCMVETISDIKLSARSQVALAQTNRHVYNIIRPLLRATRVCIAAEEGRLDIIKKAYRDGANLNVTGSTKHGQRGTPLQYAIMNGHRDILEFLVEVGVDPHVPSVGLCECWQHMSDTKPYVLHTAINHGKIKGAAKLLVQKLGAYWSVKDLPALQDEPDEEKEEQKEVIDLLANLPGPGPAGDALTYAMSRHEHDLEERILARPDLDVSVADSLGRTPLFNAIVSRRLDIAMTLLERPEADAGIAQQNDLTPLHAAVDARSLPLVEALLKRPEVDATKKDDVNTTPFHLATQHGELEIVKLLLEQPGVDVASPDDDGMTPLHWAVRSRYLMLHPWKRRKGETGESFCEPAGYRSESLEIIEILLARPEVNAGLHSKDGLTPLHRACSIGDRRVAELLLKRKEVDPKARGLNGQTPLHIAASCTRRGALMLMGSLLEQPGIEITDTDYDGRTILHYVCGCLRKAWNASLVIETALREGVPIDQVSKNGLSAFHQAICSGDYNIAMLLLDLGADPMVSTRFKYNNNLLHLCLKGDGSSADVNKIMRESIKRRIEIDTLTDSPLYDAWNDEKEQVEDVEGIRSMDILIGTDCTPLFLTAIGEENIEGMRALLDAGADPNATVIIRDLELEGKTKGNRQAFLSGVFRHSWDPEEPSNDDIFEKEDVIALLIQHGSRIDFDGSADSPLQEACKAAEDGRGALLEIILKCSTSKSVSQRHAIEVISEYADKPQHGEIGQILQMLRIFERKHFGT
ncbi:uncharacterized protein FIESC28_07888 [Fusarium coffeatum]|uniref:Uncharacterized protein n=1 Tax=Fusarium coffeatum TaxID=231269 RepID=A0A366RBU4_9HYPO|nr:uncharacterized protein FIESC28_07888 [Fusarium coffeatum]RBR14038.1 hypothetical protein FIESC28_07888 [Fusarium coffeatum]